MEDRKLNIQQLEKAIENREGSYRLLTWLSDAIASGTALPTPQRHAGSAEAASQLIRNNIYLAPEELLPAPEDAEKFAAFFGAYLTSTFDVIEKPGTQGDGPLGLCNCEVCMRIVGAPHLQPRKLFARDKRRANRLMEEYLEALSSENGLEPGNGTLVEMVESPLHRRNIALITYCHWLILRMAGECDGPAVLALWRLASRSSKGGMLPDFTLNVTAFEKAETGVLSALREMSNHVT